MDDLLSTGLVCKELEGMGWYPRNILADMAGRNWTWVFDGLTKSENWKIFGDYPSLRACWPDNHLSNQVAELDICL